MIIFFVFLCFQTEYPTFLEFLNWYILAKNVNLRILRHLYCERAGRAKGFRASWRYYLV